MKDERIHAFLGQDHERLDALLAEASESGGAVDSAGFKAFRGGLLRHIGMEEKFLFPSSPRLGGGGELPVVRQLRLDHCALVALLIPTPTPGGIGRIRALLAAHNPLEEEPGGFYDACDQLAPEDREGLLKRLKDAPELPLAPHFDGGRAFENIDRLLREAGREDLID